MLRRIRRILANDRGNALLIAAASMPVLIGAGGLATDTIQWTLWNRQIQRQADSAALAGAYAKAQGGNPTTSATAEINRHSFVTLSASPVIENAPTKGAYAGDTDAVRVVLQTSNALPFSSFFLSSPPVITVEATAAAVTSGEYCVVSLESTTAVGVTLQGGASVNMGCGIITNSQAANAVVATGSSTVVATPVAAVGGLQSSSNYVSPTTLQPYSIAQPDPFADLPEPVPPTPCNPKQTVEPKITQEFEPGCYAGMELKGTVTLKPGTYFIDAGSFTVTSKATVVGTGVTIILTATDPASIGQVTIDGGASVNLSAPTSGPFAGVLLYQDRDAADSDPDLPNMISGNSGSTLEGAIYLPRQEVEFTGSSGMNTNCLQIVSRRVTFTGSNNISNKCEGTGLEDDEIVGTQIRLVG